MKLASNCQSSRRGYPNTGMPPHHSLLPVMPLTLTYPFKHSTGSILIVSPQPIVCAAYSGPKPTRPTEGAAARVPRNSLTRGSFQLPGPAVPSVATPFKDRPALLSLLRNLSPTCRVLVGCKGQSKKASLSTPTRRQGKAKRATKDKLWGPLSLTPGGVHSASPACVP